MQKANSSTQTGTWAAARSLKTFQFQEIPVREENFWAVTISAVQLGKQGGFSGAKVI